MQCTVRIKAVTGPVPREALRSAEVASVTAIVIPLCGIVFSEDLPLRSQNPRVPCRHRQVDCLGGRIPEPMSRRMCPTPLRPEPGILFEYRDIG
jgi:hypothetical protein